MSTNQISPPHTCQICNDGNASAKQHGNGSKDPPAAMPVATPGAGLEYPARNRHLGEMAGYDVIRSSTG